MKFAFGSTAEKNGFPRIDRIAPAAAIPGGEIVIHGSGFASRTGARPIVHFGEAEASLVLATDNRLIARVPDKASRIPCPSRCKSRTTCIQWQIPRSTPTEIYT